MAIPDIYERKMIDVLTPELKGLVRGHYTVHQFAEVGVTWEGGSCEERIFPLHEMERHSVFKTSTDLGTYNHHMALVKWRGEYWFAWDNCMVNEEWPGQRTFISHSSDGMTWSERILVADGDEERGMLRNLSGLYACGETLYAFIQEKWDLAHATAPGMSVHENTKVSVRNDIWASQDGVTWDLAKENYADVRWVFENPRLTREGRLMVPMTGRNGEPGVVLWLGDDPLAEPKVIRQPWHGREDRYDEGHDEGNLLLGRGLMVHRR